jgi:hypothetical protein
MTPKGDGSEFKRMREITELKAKVFVLFIKK